MSINPASETEAHLIGFDGWMDGWMWEILTAAAEQRASDPRHRMASQVSAWLPDTTLDP